MKFCQSISSVILVTCISLLYFVYLYSILHSLLCIYESPKSQWKHKGKREFDLIFPEHLWELSCLEQLEGIVNKIILWVGQQMQPATENSNIRKKKCFLFIEIQHFFLEEETVTLFCRSQDLQRVYVACWPLRCELPKETLCSYTNNKQWVAGGNSYYHHLNKSNFWQLTMYENRFWNKKMPSFQHLLKYLSLDCAKNWRVAVIHINSDWQFYGKIWEDLSPKIIHMENILQISLTGCQMSLLFYC